MTEQCYRWFMRSEIIEPKPELTLILVPSPDEPPQSSSELQDAFRTFQQALISEGIPITARYRVFDAVGAGSHLSGEFVLKTLAVIVPPAITGITGWFKGRSGRKFRVKYGAIEAEATTTKEAEETVLRLQQHNQPKVIREP